MIHAKECVLIPPGKQGIWAGILLSFIPVVNGIYEK
jgi:hypothetical protein